MCVDCNLCLFVVIIAIDQKEGGKYSFKGKLLLVAVFMSRVGGLLVVWFMSTSNCFVDNISESFNDTESEESGFWWRYWLDYEQLEISSLSKNNAIGERTK